MTVDTIWQGEPCPRGWCPKPGYLRSWFYRTSPWVCPLCCYGWIRQDPPKVSEEGAYYWTRTEEPMPFYRPGKRRAQILKPFK